MKGKFQTEEAKKKISKSNTGKRIGFAITSKEMNERQKKLKTGFYSSELQSELSKRAEKSIGGLITARKYRIEKEKNSEWYQKLFKKRQACGLKLAEISHKKLNNKYEYNGIFYDSKSEREFAKYLLENNILKEINEENFQINIGNKWYDFLINNIFVEFHPYDFQGRSDGEYFSDRKQNLIKNGYDNKLIVVKTIEDFKYQWSIYGNNR
jgi:hypothetical protein